MQSDVARLEHSDVHRYQSYKHLLGVPKPLLPLNDSPLIDYWIRSLRAINDHMGKDVIRIEHDVYIVTNDMFYSQFVSWAEQRNHFPREHILNDGTGSNSDRLGAVADIQFAISHFMSGGSSSDEHIDDEDLMIIGGDTLFSNEFHSRVLCQIMQREGFCGVHGAGGGTRPVLLYYSLPSSVNISEKGIIEVEPIINVEKQQEEEEAQEEGSPTAHSPIPMKVVRFLEKPKPHETESRLASPCFYLLDKSSVCLVQQFLDHIQTASSNDCSAADSKYLRDAPGHFVRYLTQVKELVVCYKIEQRFDVGHLDEYIETDEYWKSQIPLL